MNWTQLVIKEIVLRRANFGLATITVAVAVTVGLLSLWQLRIYDADARTYLDQQRVKLEQEMASLEDDYRKITKELGYNLVILPAGQDLAAYYAGDATRVTMPEEFVDRLASTNLMTIQHLLPIVEQHTTWPEQGNRAIVLAGTRGETPPVDGAPKGPIMPAVHRDQLVVGYRLWHDCDLAVGARVMLKGHEFEVAKCLPEKGSKEDLTVWASLEQAQELLECPRQVHAIMALKCHCDGNDLDSIRRAVAQILPDVQVLEIADKAWARGRARDRAKQAAELALSEEKTRREELQRQRKTLATWIVPGVWCSAAAIVGALALLNVRERYSEIGVLRAFGVRSGRLLTFVLARGLLVGMCGALIGSLIAILALWMNNGTSGLQLIARSHNARLEGLILVAAAPFLTLLVAWPPAMLAARRDPAVVLGQD